MLLRKQISDFVLSLICDIPTVIPSTKTENHSRAVDKPISLISQLFVRGSIQILISLPRKKKSSGKKNHTKKQKIVSKRFFLKGRDLSLVRKMTTTDTFLAQAKIVIVPSKSAVNCNGSVGLVDDYGWVWIEGKMAAQGPLTLPWVCIFRA